MISFNKNLFCILINILAILHSIIAVSVNKESLKCVEAINYYEGRYSIPKGLLHSISIVESGRLDEVEKKIYPWPWAVNVEGAPYYFNDEQSAIHFVRTKLAAGVKSIDVGCNQISLLHHGKNFPSLNHAFNPYHNSRYAAEFLQSNYNESKNWFTAVGWYHSKTASLSRQYSQRVHKVWKGFVGSYKEIKTHSKQKVTQFNISNKAKRKEKSIIFMKR
jgi:hypothetical protein